MLLILGLILGVALILGLTIYSSLSWGLVMMKFYGWFLLPVFTTLPLIDYWQAVGLALFATLLKTHSVSTVKDEYQEASKGYVGLLYPWITLLFGYAIYSWFM